jgi:uncharacterized membrane protein
MGAIGPGPSRGLRGLAHCKRKVKSKSFATPRRMLFHTSTMRLSAHSRRRFRRSVLKLKLVTGVYLRRISLRYHKNKRNLYRFLGVVCFASLLVLLGSELFRYKPTLRANAETLSASGITSQLGIAVGAAMLGVIGIVFSLSLFSIQQVAERGTSLTLREYASDWVLRLVYSSLAIFTVFATAAALLKKESAVLAIAVNFVILISTILLLKLYFNRTIRFSDPHFIVSRIAERARKSLGTIKRMERVTERELRYRRRKGQV